MPLKFFKPDGSLRDDQPTFGDPYRDRPDEGTFSALHADNEGFSCAVANEAAEVVKLEDCAATSIAAQIYHAGVFSNNTKGNYAEIYYWR